VKIITPGTPRKDRLYRATCRECHCEFEFHESEATLHSDQRDGDYVSLPCPTCNVIVTVTTKR